MNGISNKMPIEFGSWLSKNNWDYFSTITFRHDIKRKRNESLMLQLEEYLKGLAIKFKLFWVMESTSNGYQTHNHLLIEGEGVKEEVHRYFADKRLIDKRFVKHIPYWILRTKLRQAFRFHCASDFGSNCATSLRDFGSFCASDFGSFCATLKDRAITLSLKFNAIWLIHLILWT